MAPRSTVLGSLDAFIDKGVYSPLTVGLAAVEVKVGTRPLENRQMVFIQPKAAGVFYGFDSSVTTATGIEIFKDQLIGIGTGPNLRIWLIATGAGKDVRIQELA